MKMTFKDRSPAQSASGLIPTDESGGSCPVRTAVASTTDGVTHASEQEQDCSNGSQDNPDGRQQGNMHDTANDEQDSTKDNHRVLAVS